MKWFQLDSDMPHDPKIRAVTRALGLEGLGGLVNVWCHVAKHGHRPGQAIDARGAPLPLDDILEASMLGGDKFAQLVDVCTRTGHFRREAWERHHGIWIPAMERRADQYARRLARSQQLTINWTGE